MNLEAQYILIQVEQMSGFDDPQNLAYEGYLSLLSDDPLSARDEALKVIAERFPNEPKAMAFVIRKSEKILVDA